MRASARAQVRVRGLTADLPRAGDACPKSTEFAGIIREGGNAKSLAQRGPSCILLRMTRDELTKSQRKALNRVTGFGALEVQSLEKANQRGDVFAKIGSRFTPRLFVITVRGHVEDLGRV